MTLSGEEPQEQIFDPPDEVELVVIVRNYGRFKSTNEMAEAIERALRRDGWTQSEFNVLWD